MSLNKKCTELLKFIISVKKNQIFLSFKENKNGE